MCVCVRFLKLSFIQVFLLSFILVSEGQGQKTSSEDCQLSQFPGSFVLRVSKIKEQHFQIYLLIHLSSFWSAVSIWMVVKHQLSGHVDTHLYWHGPFVKFFSVQHDLWDLPISRRDWWWSKCTMVQGDVCLSKCRYHTELGYVGSTTNSAWDGKVTWVTLNCKKHKQMHDGRSCSFKWSSKWSNICF